MPPVPILSPAGHTWWELRRWKEDEGWLKKLTIQEKFSPYAGGKRLDDVPAPQFKYGFKPGSTVEEVRPLNKENFELVVILPDGQTLSMTLCREQLQSMTVSQFKKALLRVLAIQGYTKKNVILQVDGKLLDNPSALLADYRITAGSTVQMLLEVFIILPDGQTLSMTLCPKQLQSMTVSQFKEAVLRVCAIEGYTEKYVTLQVEGKLLDNPSALLADYGIKADSTVQMLLEVFITLPDGQRRMIPLSAKDLQEMTVGLLKEEVLKMLTKKGYTEENVKLHLDGRPLDIDCALVTTFGIKPGKKVLVVVLVHGG